MKAIQDATDMLKEQASNIGEGAKEKSYQLIEDWLQIFPRLQQYGLRVNSFALQVAISPALEAELVGHHVEFSMDSLDAILNSCKGNPALTSVFTAIRTTYLLHSKTNLPLIEPLIVRIRIKLTPEIKVYLGKALTD